MRMFASAFRDEQVAVSKGRYKGIYSLFSLLGLILIVWGYGQARQDNVFLYALPDWVRHVQFLLMIPAMVFLVASELPAGHIKKAVKNPLLVGVKTWAVAHLLVNGDLASVLLFGAFLVWAVILGINTKRRGQTFPDETSGLSDLIAIAAGIALWAAFVFGLHEWLIGVPLVA